MKWYEIRQYGNVFEVYQAVNDGRGTVTYTRYKEIKTRKGAESFAKKHWVRRWL